MIQNSVQDNMNKFIAAANRNRYDAMFNLMNVDINDANLYLTPSVHEGMNIEMMIPMDKVNKIQRLKFAEFNYDIRSLVAGVAASVSLGPWAILFDLEDFVAGMYVGMKVMDLVNEDVVIFGTDLANVSVDASRDYINLIYDCLEDNTLQTQKVIKNYIYENF